MMKKLSVLVMVLCSLASVVWGAGGCDQHRLNREEFRARQQAFITRNAGLTKEEADNFFPVYFELQDRKKQLNDEAWDLLRKGKGENVTEEQYGEILEGVYDAGVAADRLDKIYLAKFKKILSYKKIYLVRRAEMRFHRELLRGMQRNEKAPGKPPRKG